MSTYIAPNATVIGDVRLGNDVGIWYGAIIRGDSNPITIGDGSNIQDNAILHELTVVGKNCTVGHAAIVHGCTVGDNCTIGMGAIILNGAVIGNNCIVGAGSVVTGKMNAPDGSLILGNPAKVVKPVSAEQLEHSIANTRHYVELARKGLPEV